MSIRFTFALLAVLCVGPMVRCQPTLPAQDEVAKLIARLAAAEFRARDQAGRELMKSGGAVLPALRQAVTPNVDLETRRRIENLIERIENDLLAAETKNWQTLDAPPYVKDRLVKIMTRNPSMTDAKCVAAAYLVAANRRPTELEAAQALQELKHCNYRLASVLRIIRPFVRGNGASADLVYSYAQVDKALENPHAFTEYGHNILQEAIKRFGTALSKGARTDQDLADLLYLLVLSRYPNSAETSRITTTLANDADRASSTSFLVRAVQKSAEFKEIR
jgi:hypothetical protein